MSKDDEIFNRLVAEQKEEMGEESIEFDGQNCDDCSGWDGESSRCDCGNRRVYWVLSDDKTFVYAQAD